MFFAQPTFLDSRPDLRSTLFALGALALVSVPLLRQLPTGVIVVFATCLLVRVLLLVMGFYGLKTWQNLLLLAGAGLLVMQQLGTVFGLQGGIAFLLLLSLVKSYEGKTRRDWQVLVLAMLFLLTGAVLFDDGMMTGLWVLMCLVLMAVTLAMLNDMSLKMSLRQSLIGFSLTLLPMVVLFVTMPRRDAPLWGVPQNQAAKGRTGMSDTMKPGSIGELVLSNEPVFSATFANGMMPQQKDLYWRMMILGSNNGTQWEATTDYADLAAAPRRGRQVEYQMIVQDDNGRLPVLDYPAAITQKGFIREAGAVLRVRSRQGLRRITWRSVLTDELPHALSDSEIRYYTRLPERSNLRTRALAVQLARQSGGDAETFIRNVYQYFTKQGFRYTLKPQVAGSRDATDEFMFSGKQGFCEHYADAFVVMMRAGGLPARVVAGYQGGEYNVQGNFWQIRSKDAHAWAEVWLPEKRVWKRVDPTAAVAAIRIDGNVNDALPAEENDTLLPKSNYWNTVVDQGRFYWQQWIVNYDNDRQQNLFAKIGLGKANPLTILIALLIGMIPAMLPVWLWWTRSRKSDIRPLDDGFLLLKYRLLGKDHLNLSTLGPLELQHELEQNGRLTPDLEQLINDYIRLNFGSRNTPPERETRAWYARARKLSGKYRLKTG